MRAYMFCGIKLAINAQAIREPWPLNLYKHRHFNRQKIGQQARAFRG